MKLTLKYITWSLCVTAWVTIGFILPDFLDNPLQDFHTVISILAYLLALGGASFWLVYLVGLNRNAACIGLPLIGICGAGVSYFRVAFHATITPMIIDATLHTNTGTIAGVISWQLIVWIVVSLLVSIGFIIWRLRLQDVPYAWIQALVALVLMLVYYNANDRLKASINQRFPYNIVHSCSEYVKQQHQLSEVKQVLSYEPIALADSIDIIFVLGEAMRADHLQLNGYTRNTTPQIASRNNIVSLPYIYSEHTYTSTSVPHILTPADSLHPEWSASHCSFIRIMAENGFQTAWISNQDNGRTYFSFIHEADTIIFPNASKSTYVFDPWYDEQLLPPLDSVMMLGGKRRLVVLHTIGSHWYYNNHVPTQWQIFQPMTSNRVITNNTEEQIINSYDNTAVYLDVVLDSLIQRVENRLAIIIYLSDHGEALGEDGNYLHAGENYALHRPACIIWYSEKYATAYPDKIQALIANKDKYYRTDFLYYSILSAAGIEAEGHTSAVNIFE